jgi:exonuclease III
MKKKNIIYAQWGLDFLMSPGKSDSRGTLILCNNNFEHKVLRVRADPDGNYIISSILIENKYSICIVNLYGPNRDFPEFFDKLSDIIDEFSDDFVIMCGDWNLVQDYNLDCYNYVRENNPKNKSQVLKLKEKFYLIDPWRIINPDSKSYTWSKKQKQKNKKKNKNTY